MTPNYYEVFLKITHNKFFSSIIIICISILLYKLVNQLLSKGETRTKADLAAEKRRKTYIKLTKSITKYIFIIITILILLKANGVDVNSALAGVGIASVIFGLAIQDWLKDIIRGSSIISDHYFSVGDVVKYKDIEGKVLIIGFKTTKIQDLKTSNIISIANRNIEEIQVVSKFVYVKIPIPYEISVEKAEDAISDIMERINHNDHVNSSRYVGITELADSSIQYLLEIDCDQHFKLQVRRDALRSIVLGLADHNIQVPYTQIDIHEK